MSSRMVLSFNLLFKAAVVAACLTGVAFAASNGGENTMAGTELKSCRADGRMCLTVRSEKTEGSRIKTTLHVLKKPKLVLEDRKNGKRKEMTADSGFLDIELNQVVLVEKRKNGSVKEISYDLTTLERMETEYR